MKMYFSSKLAIALFLPRSYLILLNMEKLRAKSEQAPSKLRMNCE